MDEFDAKMEYPQLVKVTIYGSKGGKDYKLRARINPFHITSYCESAIQNEGDEIPCTWVVVGGQSYNVAMSIEEFDEMMDSIDKGIKIA